MWRKAISLFYERKKPAWMGPFKASGYRGVGPQGIQVEPALLDAKGKDWKPDIVTAGPAHWVALELTTDPTKPKTKQLQAHGSLDGNYLTSYSLPAIPGSPIVLLARPRAPDAPITDGDFPLLLLGDEFAIAKAELIKDPNLRDALTGFAGSRLDAGPELTFTLVPEVHSKPHELRFSAAASIMQLFKSETAETSIRQIVEHGLDILVPSVSVRARQQLEDDMAAQIDILMSKHGLKEYVEKADRVLRPKPGVNLGHFKTREKITNILESWVTAPTAGVRLTDFISEPREDSEASA